MKSISTRLLAHLGQDTTTLAMLWKVARTDGVIMGFTDHDTPIRFTDSESTTPVVYEPQSGGTSTATDTSSDMSTSNSELTSFLESDAITEGDIFAGRYDFAVIEVRLVNWADLTQGALLWKRATMGQVKMKNGLFQTELRGLEFYFSTMIGETYGPTCRADLGDSRCTIDLSLWIQSGSVNTVSGTYPKRTFVPNTALVMRGSGTPTTPAPSAWFNGGVLTLLTGANAGFNIEVGAWDGTTISTFEDLPYAVQSGDRFTIEPGCKKDVTTCFAKFNNVPNFRGEPQIPGMDAVLIYPNADGSVPS